MMKITPSFRLLLILLFIVCFGLGMMTFSRLLQNNQKAATITHKSPTITNTVILGGDIMLSRTIGSDNKKQGYDRMFRIPNYHPLASIPAFNSGNALLLFNLESQFSPRDNDIEKGGFMFRANTGNIDVLRGLRKNNTMILSLANNHVSNAGGDGMETTTTLLDQQNIYHVGAGTSKEQARSILKLNYQGITRCINGYSYDGDEGIYGGKLLYWNSTDKLTMLEDLQIMSGMNCDIKAMILHRGTEYKMKPNQGQINLAHNLIDSGLDLLIGSHPHVPSTIELYNGKYIFYSLGNTIFDQDAGRIGRDPRMNVIYDATLQKDMVPTYITMFPILQVNKNGSGVSIKLDHIQTARLKRGLFSPNDPQTEKNLIDAVWGSGNKE